MLKRPAIVVALWRVVLLCATGMCLQSTELHTLFMNQYEQMLSVPRVAPTVVLTLQGELTGTHDMSWMLSQTVTGTLSQTGPACYLLCCCLGRWPSLSEVETLLTPEGLGASHSWVEVHHSGLTSCRTGAVLSSLRLSRTWTLQGVWVVVLLGVVDLYPWSCCFSTLV